MPCSTPALEVSPEISVPAGYTLRLLAEGDYDKGFTECLANLTRVGEVGKAKFAARFKQLQSLSDLFQPIVLEKESTGRIVASGTLLVEPKFIHECGFTGHIEDIIVDPAERGRNFGRVIVQQLTHMARRAGCYKVILDCDDKNVEFYAKCGFAKKDIQMAIYFDK